ncbi:MAG: hypothetical protein OXC68_08935, partial [Aestuariivita sp.]|nr:hypothetical protein [Aestuariivita sp.]
CVFHNCFFVFGLTNFMDHNIKCRIKKKLGIYPLNMNQYAVESPQLVLWNISKKNGQNIYSCECNLGTAYSLYADICFGAKLNILTKKNALGANNEHEAILYGFKSLIKAGALPFMPSNY